jgi:hypothetical protein
VWTSHVSEIPNGAAYGYRVHGPFAPEPRSSLQRQQAAARPVRSCVRRPPDVARVALRPRSSAAPLGPSR